MAVFWNFPGKTKTWLEDELAKVLDDQAQGKTVISYTGGDSSGSDKVLMGVAERKTAILSDLAALTAASLTTVPATYVRTQVLPAKRTKVQYA